MLNGHNGDVHYQLVLPMVEEPETDVVQFATIPSGSMEFTLGGPCILV